MCKHKSGGMSKPSGTTSQGGSGLTERTSSLNCPQDGTTNSQVPAPSYRSQTRGADSETPTTCSDSCDENSETEGSLRSYTIANALESVESEEEDTEQSPMLYCGAEAAFDESRRFDPYACATNCDIAMYHKLDLQNALQKPVSYIPLPYRSAGAMACSTSCFNGCRNEYEFSESAKSKRKWLLNQKCKSADGGCVASVSNPVAAAPYFSEHATNDAFSGQWPDDAEPVAGPSGLQNLDWEVGEFRGRSYSLTPTIHLESEVFEPQTTEAPPKTIDDAFRVSIPVSPSAAQLSIASSYGENGSPICKICHMTARENDPLISPCRCSGTMQYIHCGCLMRWLEVCHKRGRRPASCELCQYQYHWHKKFKIRHWQMPQCSRKDKILHLLFFLSVLLMITCASITVLCFKQDKGTKMDPDRTELTHSEIVTLVCGVLFFFAFFVAMYVEVKSHNTLYQLLVKFIHINQQWYIDEYEKKETSPVAV